MIYAHVQTGRLIEAYMRMYRQTDRWIEIWGKKHTWACIDRQTDRNIYAHLQIDRQIETNINMYRDTDRNIHAHALIDLYKHACACTYRHGY